MIIIHKISRFAIGVLLASVTSIAATSADAVVLFDEIFDANRLAGGAGVTLNGDRTATVIGTSVRFGTSNSSTADASYLDISLFGAGLLTDSAQYTVTIEVNEDRAIGTADQDAVFVVHDGVTGTSIQHFDNNGGGYGFRGVGLTGTNPRTITSAGGSTLVEGVGADTWTGQFLVGLIEGSEVLSPAIPLETFGAFDVDVSQGLTFSLFGSDATEEFGFESIRITVEGPEIVVASVTEPGALLLFGVGMIGLVAGRLHRTERR